MVIPNVLIIEAIKAYLREVEQAKSLLLDINKYSSDNSLLTDIDIKLLEIHEAYIAFSTGYAFISCKDNSSVESLTDEETNIIKTAFEILKRKL